MNKYECQKCGHKFEDETWEPCPKCNSGSVDATEQNGVDIEDDMTVDEITKDILNTVNEDKVLDDVSEAIYDYIDEGWEDEFDDITEAYGEQGRGEAESQILNEVLVTWQSKNNVELSLDDFCEVFENLASEWCLTTD